MRGGNDRSARGFGEQPEVRLDVGLRVNGEADPGCDRALRKRNTEAAFRAIVRARKRPGFHELNQQVLEILFGLEVEPRRRASQVAVRSGRSARFPVTNPVE